MNKKNMTFSHMIDVAEACIEVENQQSKHAIMHAAGLTEEELDTMWAQKRDDFFWSHNFGGMNCRADVYKGWAGGLAQNAHYYYRRLLQVYPEVEGKEPRTLMECAVHMLGSSIIEVADDGMSARGSWYTPGVIFSTLNPDQKKEGIWIWERYGNDFVKEDDEWYILSQHVCNDYGGAMDKDNWAQVAYERMTQPPMPRPQPEPADDGSLPGAPWAPMRLFYASYSPVQTPQNACPWPSPYKTFDREHTSYCVPFAEGEYSITYPIPDHPVMP